MLGTKLVVKHADGQVVAAGKQNRIGDFLYRTQEFDLHLRAGVQAFVQGRNAQHPVGFDHRGDDPGAASDGVGHDRVPNLTEVDPHKLFQAEPRRHLARQDRPRS